MARHFNEMMARINQFSGELKLRVTEAVAEADQRYQEVQRLNEQLFELGRRLSHAERLAVSGRIAAEVAHEVGRALHSVAGHLESCSDGSSPARGADGRHTPAARRHREPAQARHRDHHPAPRRDPPLGGICPRASQRELPAARDARRWCARAMSAAGLIPARGGGPRDSRGRRAREPAPAGDLNLLTNAMDATAPGGGSRSRLGPIPIAARWSWRCGTAGRMGAAERRQIFEPFFSDEGALARQRARPLHLRADRPRSQGRDRGETARASGSVFRICLPAAGAMA